MPQALWLIGRMTDDGAKQYLDGVVFHSEEEANAYIAEHPELGEAFAFGPMSATTETETKQ